jgi:hypothetical protein
MTFEEHLAHHRQADGSFDVAAAEADLAEEYANDGDELERLAKRAAASERRRWETSNRNHLRKQWSEAQGSLDLEAMVPIGDSIVVPLGAMNGDRIAVRIEMVTKSHLDHLNAFTSEMEFWRHWRSLLGPDETIGDAA